MKNLYVFDVSGVVYYGTTGFASSFADSTFRKFPVGGIKTLASRLSMAFAENADVVLAFDSRSRRKDLFPEYKGDRIPNRAVMAQLDFLYDHLCNARIPCVKYNGYEADDIIYWTVKQYARSYQHVIIYSNDHDVAHNVQYNVSMKPFSKSSPIISYSNFEYSVVKGKVIPWNTISAYKVFMGCSSDKIPKFKSKQYSSEGLYRAFVKFLEDNGKLDQYLVATNPNALVIFVNSSGFFDDEEKDTIFKRIQLIYPEEKPEDVVITPVNKHIIDVHTFSEMLVMCRDYDSLTHLKQKSFDLSKDFLATIDSYSKSLTSGAYSVDRDLEVDPSYEEDSDMLFLKEF